VKKLLYFILISICGLLLFQCESDKPKDKVPIIWTQLDRFSKDLPSSVHIYYGVNYSLPLKVWYAEIDITDPEILVEVISAKDEDHLETLTQICDRNKSIIGINAGFFRNDGDSTRHIGLLMENEEIIHSAIRSLIYKEQRYFTARGAFGIGNDGSIDIAWVSERNDSLFEWTSPIKNKRERPHKPIHPLRENLWKMTNAVQAGPVLVSDGKVNVTSNEEVFFHSNITKLHPRSAAGITEDDKLILIVVEGRYIGSRGVYLQELATIMKNLGCVEAINLDGGGSSGLVVNGLHVSTPSDGKIEREIMSAITVSVR